MRAEQLKGLLCDEEIGAPGGGFSEARCDRVAIAFRRRTATGMPYPVCRKHIRSPMCPVTGTCGILQ